ncbi:MAG: hypothetical protein NTW08_09220 [Gammaproteobacteria bacterium]|nr:hypothetical protein [Gammaproteobacteria bacterium]
MTSKNHGVNAMKNNLWIASVCVLASMFLITGCQTPKNAELISFKRPAHPVRVETENIRWGTTSEENQELADEI